MHGYYWEIGNYFNIKYWKPHGVYEFEPRRLWIKFESTADSDTN